jgi:hypothetical protein
VDWNRLRRTWPWTVFAIAVLVLQLGSRGDRLVVVAVWLSLVLLPVERYVHQLAGFLARTVLPRYVLLSTIPLAWSWGNARFRLGGGPFHIVNAGIWRGYPFMSEEWDWSQGGLSEITWWREFHWLGLLVDLLIPAAMFLLVLRWLRRSSAPVDGIRALLFVVFTAAFTWLNIEPWIGGLPLTVAGPPPPFRPPAYFSSGITRGFPLIFWNGFISDPKVSLIAANVTIGLCAWIGLYLAAKVRPALHGHEDS